MKKLVFILLSLFLSDGVMAQEKVTSKQREIGIVFQNLDNFGLTYKIGNKKSLWRFNTLLLAGSSIETEEEDITETENSIGIGFKIGREYRKNIVNNLDLKFGFDLGFTYSKDKTEDSPITKELKIYEYGFNLVFGFNYLLGDNFTLGVELLPHFTYRDTKSTASREFGGVVTNQTISKAKGFYYGISNNSVMFTLAYKF